MFASLSLPRCQGQLRPLKEADLESLIRHANDAEVGRWLADVFPQPYSAEDARAYLAFASQEGPEHIRAIEVDGEFAGTFAIRPGVRERRLVVSLGYWLGRLYWGRGIMAEAVSAASDFLLDHEGFVRVQAEAYEPNTQSARVLEKAGFALECVHRKAVIKHGQVHDVLHYAKVR